MKYLTSFHLRSGEQIDGTIDEAPNLPEAFKRDLAPHLRSGAEWITVECFNGDLIAIPVSNIAYVVITDKIPDLEEASPSSEGEAA